MLGVFSVPFTVVPLPCLLSFWLLSVVLSCPPWGLWFWPFGFPGRLPPLRWTVLRIRLPLPGFFGGGSKGTELLWMGELRAALGDLVRAVQRLSIAVESPPVGSSSSGAVPSSVDFPDSASDWEVVSDEVYTQDLIARLSRVPFGDYDGFAELIPVCPPHIVAGCSRLAESEFTSTARAKRAFEAGFWARLVVQGKLDTPRATPNISHRPAVYIILRASGIDRPTRVANASDLHRVTGKLSQETVCHGFPSQAEAKAYCAGAGVQYPQLKTWP